MDTFHAFCTALNDAPTADEVRGQATKVSTLWNEFGTDKQKRVERVNTWKKDRPVEFKQEVLEAILSADQPSFVCAVLYTQFAGNVDHAKVIETKKGERMVFPAPHRMAYNFFLACVRNKGAEKIKSPLPMGEVTADQSKRFLELVDNPHDGPLFGKSGQTYSNWMRKHPFLEQWLQACDRHEFRHYTIFNCTEMPRKRQRAEPQPEEQPEEDAGEEVDPNGGREEGTTNRGRPTEPVDEYLNENEPPENFTETTVLPQSSLQVLTFLKSDADVNEPVLVSREQTQYEIPHFLALVRYSKFAEEGIEEKMRAKWAALEHSRHRELLYVHTEMLARELGDSPEDNVAYGRLINILPEHQRRAKRVFVDLTQSELEEIAANLAKELSEHRNNAIEQIRPQHPTQEEIKDLIRFAKGEIDVAMRFGHLKGWEKRNKMDQLRRLKPRLKVAMNNGEEELYVEKAQSVGLKRKQGYETSTYLKLIPANEYVPFLTKQRYNARLGVVNYGQETVFVSRVTQIVFTGKEVNPLTGTNLGLPTRLIKEFIKQDIGTTESDRAAPISSRLSRVYHAPYKCVQIDLKEVVVRPGKEIEVFDLKPDERNANRAERNMQRLRGRGMDSVSVPVGERNGEVVVQRLNASVKYFMVVIDCFSKHAWMFPMERKVATQVVANLQTLAGFCGWGYPHEVRMDNGSEFVAQIVKDELAKQDVIITYGAVRTPEGQGVVERFNRTFKQYLNSVLRHKHFVSQTQGGVQADVHFDLTFINNFLHTYNNNVIHSKIGATPNTIIHGRDPKVWARRPADITDRVVSTSLRNTAEDGNYAFDFIGCFAEHMRTKKTLAEYTIEAFKASRDNHLREMATKGTLNFFFLGEQCKFKVPTRFTESGVREWGWSIVVVTRVHLTQGNAFTNMYDVAPLIGGRPGEPYKGVRVEQLKRMGDAPKVVKHMIDFAKKGLLVRYEPGMDKWRTDEELSQLRVVHSAVNTSFQIIKGTYFQRPEALPPYLKEKYETLRRDIARFYSYRTSANEDVVRVATRFISQSSEVDPTRKFIKELDTLQNELRTRKDRIERVNSLGNQLTSLAHENKADTDEYRELQAKFDRAQEAIYNNDKKIKEMFNNESLLGALNIDRFFRANLRVDSNVLIAVFQNLQQVYAEFDRKKEFIVLLRMLGTAQRYIDFINYHLGGSDYAGSENKEDTVLMQALTLKESINAIIPKL